MLSGQPTQKTRARGTQRGIFGLLAGVPGWRLGVSIGVRVSRSEHTIPGLARVLRFGRADLLRIRQRRGCGGAGGRPTGTAGTRAGHPPLHPRNPYPPSFW